MKDKRKLLIDAALRLFVTEGVTVTTARIAKEAGVATGTLFNYFPTKQDLMDGIYVDIKSDFQDIFENIRAAGTLKERLYILWREYVLWATENPMKHKGKRLLRTAHCLSPDVSGKIDENLQWLGEVLSEGIKEGQLINIDLGYFMEILGAQGDACFNYATDNNLTDKKLRQHIDAGFLIFWNGLRNTE